MSPYLLTIAIAFVMMVVAMTCLACGWLFTGKPRLRHGACGRDPTKMSEDDECSTKSSCHICSDDDKKS